MFTKKFGFQYCLNLQCDADRWARFTVLCLKLISLPQVDFPFILHATAKGDIWPQQDASDKYSLFLGKKYTLYKVYDKQQWTMLYSTNKSVQDLFIVFKAGKAFK